MGYLYDLVSCPAIKSINETAKEKYQGLKRLFAFNSYPDLIVPNLPTAYSINDQFVKMFKVCIKDPLSPGPGRSLQQTHPPRP